MEKLYFILGCTACGKAAVGRQLARQLGAHILSVDSMKIYRRMNIGTATPSQAAQQEIPHHGIDLVEPSEPFSVAQYITAADTAIAAIRQQGAIPLAIGGTSLYIKALSEGLFEGPPGDPQYREELKRRIEAETATGLHEELARVDPVSAERIHPNDEKRLIRALEVFHQTGTPISQLQTQWDSAEKRYECVMIALRREKESQSRRINARVKKMVEMGLLDEVKSLLAEPPPLSRQAAQAVGYAEVISHLRGELTFDKAVEKIKINTRRLAKKQRTWHRRWATVQWFDIPDDESPQVTAGRILKEVNFE
ncbi:MAG: tRNA (adenosine(37)-N6)-dimethylallyltransferase MiaA [Phycisphaerae bacterium]|nr:tRNA (adenosine(37)-N6)-dimethylallyltransferase MiaA [Phycisphaerae bacterium]